MINTTMLLGVLIHFAIDQHQGECKEKQKTAGFCGHDPLVGIPNVVRRSRKKMYRHLQTLWDFHVSLYRFKDKFTGNRCFYPKI